MPHHLSLSRPLSLSLARARSLSLSLSLSLFLTLSLSRSLTLSRSLSRALSLSLSLSQLEAVPNEDVIIREGSNACRGRWMPTRGYLFTKNETNIYRCAKVAVCGRTSLKYEPPPRNHFTYLLTEDRGFGPLFIDVESRRKHCQQANPLFSDRK